MKKLGPLFIAFFLFLGAPVTMVKAENTEQLKAQVDTLTQRVAELEAQLAKTQQPASPYSSSRAAFSDWDPFEHMLMMQERANQIMGQTMNGPMLGTMGSLYDPDTDLKENDNEYLITMDIPGMDKERIDIETKGNMLMISGERNSMEREEGDRFFRQERSFGYFSRTVPLPEDANKEAISAEYKNGVLNITIGKLASQQKEAKTTKIKVQ